MHSGSLSGAMRSACSVRVIFSGLVGRDHVYAQNHNMARLHMMSDVRNIYVLHFELRRSCKILNRGGRHVRRMASSHVMQAWQACNLRSLFVFVSTE